MTKNIKNLLLMGLVSCGGAACMMSCSDSFLDQEPDERVKIVTEDQVVQLLSTAYSTGNYGWICELSSDNLQDINADYRAQQSGGQYINVRYNLNSYNRMDDEVYCFEPVRSSRGSDSPSEVWESCYGAIATANNAIQFLDKLKEQNGGQLTNKIKGAYGEAYLSRAYHHFILVNVFSQAYKDANLSKQDIGIPYFTGTEENVLVDYPRGNVADTYASIEADLEQGLAMVDDALYQMPKWHFNSKAAHAFAARFYLYKRDYDKVIEHANFVLGSNDDAGRANIADKLMSLVAFDEATTLAARREIWQGPNENNNLMLMATYSVQWRRSVGYRYAYAGKALDDIFYHLGPNWRWYRMPISGPAGETYYDGTSDHGFKSSRISEAFEYTNKVAGIGYAHIIRREFTANELLLERAEAELLKSTPDIDGAIADMIAYEDSRQSFGPLNKAFYTEGNALQPLTRALLEAWYTPTEANVSSHSNTLADWDFTQNMSSDFVVPAEVVTYMNCLNDMRRYETAWSGRRFFDLKRWGMEYTHTHREGDDNVDYTLTWNDPRRAIEVPQEVLAAGLQSSRPIIGNNPESSVKEFTGNWYKAN